MNSLLRKLKAWHRRLDKEQPHQWVGRYRRYSDRAFERLGPVPVTGAGAQTRLDRLDRHLRRLHAVRPPFATRRLDLLIVATVRHMTLWPRA